MKLLEGLRKRDAAVRVVHDAASAMVEVAQFNAQVLIVHEPEAIVELESLLAAVRLYHPGVLCWRHEAGGSGRRENLSPFACKLNQTPAPRFTPAPQSLNEPKRATSVTSELMSHVLHNRPSAQTTTNGAKRSGEPIASGSDFSIDAKDTTFTRPTHGNRVQETKPHASNGPMKQPPKRSEQVDRHASFSLGHRLATPLDALDDLTAGPLLSAEEIELLRGPQETGDA